MTFYFCMAALMVLAGICYFLNGNRADGGPPDILDDEGEILKSLKSVKISLKFFFENFGNFFQILEIFFD